MHLRRVLRNNQDIMTTRLKKPHLSIALPPNKRCEWIMRSFLKNYLKVYRNTCDSDPIPACSLSDGCLRIDRIDHIRVHFDRTGIFLEHSGVSVVAQCFIGAADPVRFSLTNVIHDMGSVFRLNNPVIASLS